MNYKDIIINIIDLLHEKNIGFGRTKLVKLSYLLDLEYYRRNKKLLTDAKWIYYLYGPYPINYNDYLESDGIQISDPNDTGFKSISLKECACIPDIPNDLKRLISSLIDEYGRMDLNDLLDYVYYDTEPMMNVKERMDELDFSTVLPREYYKINKLDVSQPTIKKLKEKYQKKFHDSTHP